MFQKVTIIGNLGGEPETRYLPSGTNVCSFSVATNRKWTNQDGTPGEETVWWRVSAWGKLGEICQQYLTKGRQVFIEGQIQGDRESGSPRIWTDQSGQPRASFELRADTMKMLGGRDEGGNSYNEGGYAQQNSGGGGSSYGQSGGGQSNQAAPARQAAPQQRPAAAAPQQRSAPANAGRRSTMSAPQPNIDDFGDDDRFDPDEIPF